MINSWSGKDYELVHAISKKDIADLLLGMALDDALDIINEVLTQESYLMKNVALFIKETENG